MLLRKFFTLPGFLLVATLGCATWQKPEQSGIRFQAPQLPVDAIVCQFAFVRWESHQVEHDQALWRAADEQIVPTEVRRRLANNGLRIAVLSGQLPPPIQQRLDETRDPVATLMAEKLPPGVEMLSRRERRQCRLGIGEVVEVLPRRTESAIVILGSDDGRVRAKQFEQPQGFFLVTATSQPDGRMRLEIMPGFEHGEPRDRVVGNLGMMRIDKRRDQHLFRELTFECPLTADQTLVVTGTPDFKGLGATFFANRFESSSEQLLLLMRLSRTQRDDLFLPLDRPFVTPTE